MCEKCNKKSQQKQPLKQHEVPSGPFEKVAADIFFLDGQNFLLLADNYSKMPFVKSLKTLTSKETIDYLESVFTIHRIPKVLISDNARQFTSFEFEFFRKQWEFKHVTSSPHYPQSNGFIERTVQTVKTCLKKAKAQKDNPQLALLSFRTTPIDNVLPSPAELLFNRKVQSQVPHILRHSNRSEDIRQHLQQKQSVQKAYFDRQARELPPLLEHQQVSVQDTNTGLWSPATIVKETEEPRRYLIETPDGTTLRRNRLHLKDSARTRPAKPPPQADDDEAGDSAASATEEESVRRSSDSIPDPQATEYITDLRPGSSNPPGPMIEKPSTTVRNNRLHTRSGRTIKPPKRYVDE
ncbi:endogenous retrovirus group k member 11 pol protein [Plakobranchus ocellatus]|uniref:Endogenous retrovirus group k member 11 pol protein n=1 Tax=Plakobranchus ocellatus TaxID=259542 RepID=A0AAV4B863_9GAST|nr:endogenous retrovirus group k member 11 pol protein [Plakobranchus ocellatus]